jgi:hypothetical protein
VRVLPHPGRTYVGGLTTDPQVVIWSMAWWPHAVVHGLNPLVTQELWAPDGVNLAWTQTAPALAVAFAPLTLAAGPIVAYNAAALLMPALAAWAAFLLCHHVTRAMWPSLFGGYLFGFSTYVIGGTLAHVQTTAVFPVPLIALVVLQFFENKLGGRGLALRLGALLALQGLLETEILFTTTLALAVALVFGAIFLPAVRGRLVALAPPVAGACALAGVFLSPLLYYAVVRSSADRPPPGNDTFVGDAVNFVVPSHVVAIGWWAGRLARDFPANDAERGTYIGIPALIIVLLFAWRCRRTGAARFLLVLFVLAVVATLGSWLTVDGRRVIVLPWSHLGARAPFEYLMPVRFSLFTALVTAVIAALWLATTRAAWSRILLPALVLVSLAPNVSLAEWAGPGARTLFSATRPTIPALFTHGGYQHCLRKDEIVLALPLAARGNALIWQAKSGFWFRLADGYITNTVPPSFLRSPRVANVALNPDPVLITLADLRAFVRRASVSSIVLHAAGSGSWRRLLDRFSSPRAIGGVLIYRTQGEPQLDGCGPERRAQGAKRA